MAEVDHVTSLPKASIISLTIGWIWSEETSNARGRSFLEGDAVACPTIFAFLWADGPIEAQGAGAVLPMASKECQQPFAKTMVGMSSRSAPRFGACIGPKELPIDRRQDPAPESTTAPHPPRASFGLEVGDGGVGDFLKQRVGSRLLVANDLMSKLRLPALHRVTENGQGEPAKPMSGTRSFNVCLVITMASITYERASSASALARLRLRTGLAK